MKNYATQSNYIRGLSARQYEWLRVMCRTSNNLYNYGLYQTRQYFFAQHSLLRYESNYKICKSNENYHLLQSAVAVQTLRYVERSFRSFLALLSKCQQGEYQYEKVRMPYYREKGGLFPLIIPGDVISIRYGEYYGKLRVPVSRLFRKMYPDYKDIYILVPSRFEGVLIKEARIIPVSGGRCFKVQYVYEVMQEQKPVDNNKVMGIDLGVNNLATCVTDETSFIIDGRKLKSINRLWNKRVAVLKSQLDRQYKDGKKHTSKGIMFLTDKRNRRVHDYMLKAARRIIDYCIAEQIGCIIVGANTGWKQGVRMGDKNTQNFVQIPFEQLRNQLSFLCWKYGIEYIEQEGSYTSKASYLDNDSMPVFGHESTPGDFQFSGKRIKRGLYRTGNGTLVNADVNGAANIARKGKQELGDGQLCRGLLVSPCRFSVETKITTESRKL